MKRRASDGFTLIELSVVLVVIAVLLSIAVATFFAARERAANVAAQSRVADALKTERAVLTDGNGFSESPEELKKAEPSLDFTTDAVVRGKVFVQVEGDVVTLASQSSSGRCYWLRDTGAATLYASGDCSTDADSLAALSWGDGW